MFELLHSWRWEEFQGFLASGTPPLAWRLLVFNGMLLLLWLMYRARRRPSGPTLSRTFPAAFLVGNLLILLSTGVNMSLRDLGITQPEGFDLIGNIFGR